MSRADIAGDNVCAPAASKDHAQRRSPPRPSLDRDLERGTGRGLGDPARALTLRRHRGRVGTHARRGRARRLRGGHQRGRPRLRRPRRARIDRDHLLADRRAPAARRGRRRRPRHAAAHRQPRHGARATADGAGRREARDRERPAAGHRGHDGLPAADVVPPSSLVEVSAASAAAADFPAALTQRARVRVVIASLMLVMLLAALDQTIVSTALPTIVGELGGLEHLSWVVTAYLLAVTIVTPLYGKLGDLYGRKRVLQVALGLFLLGSALCGAAQDMTELIAFRAVQCLGGGGLIVSAQA